MKIKRNQIFISGLVNLSAESSERPGFLINAYTGAIVDTRNLKLVFDVAGMGSKPSFPVLREHQRDRIVGHGSGQVKNGAFMVSGVFASSNDGLECFSLAQEGFPWQASVGIKPVLIRQLSPGETETINCRAITGPAEIWLKSEVSEVSFVSLGADHETSVSIFSKQNSEMFDVDIEELKKISSKKSLMLKSLHEISPENADSLYRQLVMDGVLSERKRCLDILSMNAPNISQKVEAVRSGLSLSDAYLEIFDKKRI